MEGSFVLTTKQTPCRHCLMIPACKNKPWRIVLDDCSTLRRHLRDKYKDRDPKVFGHRVSISQIKITFSVSQWQDQILVSASDKDYDGGEIVGTSKVLEDK